MGGSAGRTWRRAGTSWGAMKCEVAPVSAMAVKEGDEGLNKTSVQVPARWQSGVGSQYRLSEPPIRCSAVARFWWP